MLEYFLRRLFPISGRVDYISKKDTTAVLREFFKEANVLFIPTRNDDSKRVTREYLAHRFQWGFFSIPKGGDSFEDTEYPDLFALLGSTDSPANKPTFLSLRRRMKFQFELAWSKHLEPVFWQLFKISCAYLANQRVVSSVVMATDALLRRELQTVEDVRNQLADIVAQLEQIEQNQNQSHEHNHAPASHYFVQQRPRQSDRGTITPSRSRTETTR